MFNKAPIAPIGCGVAVDGPVQGLLANKDMHRPEWGPMLLSIGLR